MAIAAGWGAWHATKILNLYLGTDYNPSGTIYVGLYTGADDASLAEVSGGSYARVVGSFGAAVAGVMSNDAEIAFPAATADWGEITAVGYFLGLTGGYDIWRGPLVASLMVLSGQTARFPIGALSLPFTTVAD